MPNYRPPSFVQPRGYEEIYQAPRSLDQLYDRYLQSRQMGMQARGFETAQETARLQQGAARYQQLGSAAELAGQGANLQAFNPDDPNSIHSVLAPLLERKAEARRQAQAAASAGLDQERAQTGLYGAQAEASRAAAARDRALAGAGGLTPRDQLKQSQDIQELQVPGYNLGPNVRPLPAEARDLRTTSAAVKDFVAGVDRLKELINQYGSTNIMGAGSGEMTSLASNLKLSLKEVQKLGVLSSSDIAFLDAQLFDPSRLSSLGTRTSTAQEQLDTIKSRAKSALAEALKSRGYSPADGGASLQDRINKALERRQGKMGGRGQ